MSSGEPANRIVLAALLAVVAISLRHPAFGQDATPPPADPAPADTARCLEMIQSGRYSEARALAGRMVEEHPGSSRAYLLLALGYHKERRYESAEPLFAKARRLDPSDVPARLFHGWCLYNMGRADQARKAFESFLEAAPNHADGHFAIGLLDFDADLLDAATARFEKAIALAGRSGHRVDEAKARARLADILVRRNKLSDARRELERAVRLNPNLYGAYFKLSRVLQRLGDAEGAERARRMHETVRERVRPSEGHAE